MEFAGNNIWQYFIDMVKDLERSISQLQAINVNALHLRENAQIIVQQYFREVRPKLKVLGIDNNLINSIDTSMEKLLQLSNKANAKSSYISLFEQLTNFLEATTIAREYRFSEQAYQSLSPNSEIFSANERLIYNSLSELVPSAARSYKQAIIDLADKDRISYRGAANELRETLRETLDHLAPDNEVMQQQRFKLEKNQTTPTRKQKVQFIMKARGISKSKSKVPEGFIDTIEEKVSIVVSTTYVRTSIATHIQTERVEVDRIRNYVNAVLAELLALPA